MASKAPRFVGSEHLSHPRPKAAMWIVAIDTSHCAFRQAVVVRFFKLRQDVAVARTTLLIDRSDGARN
jgi:hypothetical protein